MTFGGWKSSGAKSKHGVAKKTACACGTVHDSIKESKRCADLRMLEIAGSIAGLKQQPFYAFGGAKLENGHQAGVTLDFSYVEDGRLVAEDGRYVRRDPWDRYRADPIVAAALELREWV